METVIIKGLQLIMALSFLVVIHEGGHFFFAKLFGTRVEKFYLFFNPWFSLFKYKPKNSETEYGIGWVPLGGYVKIAGMIDESMDTEQMKQPMKDFEFRAKPAWQRLLIMIGGVLFNFILALFIYVMILFSWGENYIQLDKAPLGMDFNQTAINAGFKNGDILVSADGKNLSKYDTNTLTTVIDSKTVVVRRNGQLVDIDIPSNFMQNLLGDSVSFASFRLPFVVGDVIDNSPASKAGLQGGDSIVALNGKNVSFGEFTAMMKEISKQGASSYNVAVSFYRGGELHTDTIVANEEGKIGVAAMNDFSKLMPMMKRNYTFFEAVPAGINLGLKTLNGYVSQMKYLFSKQGAKQLGGFISIGKIFPSSWDWYQFWHMTAFLSIVFAFMNILPIPALDGGHVLFLLYEILVGRKPSDKFMEYMQMAGVFLLFGLLIWANLNDILRLF